MTEEEKQLRIKQIESELARRGMNASTGDMSTEGVEQGSILPIYKKPGQTGIDAIMSGQFSSDAGVVGPIKRAVTLPYDVYRGNVQMTDPATGRTSDEAIRRSTEAASVLTPMEKGATPRAKMKTTAKAPTGDELMTSAADKIRRAEDTGASLPMQVARTVPDYILYKSGRGVAAIDDVNSPKTMKILETIRNGQGDYWTVKDIQNTRRKLWNVWLGDKDGTDGRGARLAIEAIDEIVENAGKRARELKKRGVENQLRTGREAPGSSDLAWDEASDLMKQSNSDFAAAYRSRELNKMSEAAEMGADAANSGMNVGNAYRQKAKNALQSDKKLTGFNEAERQAMRDVVSGTPGMNRSRKWANRLSGGGGWGQTTTTGLGAMAGEAIGTGMGLPTGVGGIAGGGTVFLGGQGLKSLEGNLSRKAFEGVDDLVRQRSSLYGERVAKAGVDPVGEAAMQGATKTALIAGAGKTADVQSSKVDPVLRLMTGKNTKVRDAIKDALNGGDYERAIMISNIAERKKEIAPGATMVLVKKLGLIEQGQVY